MLLFTVTHTFKGNGPKLADWSKWTCITLQSCFCSLLTSKWEVNIGRLLYSFISLFKLKKFRLQSVYWRHWNKSWNWKAWFACIYMILGRGCEQKFGFHASFMCLRRFVAICVTFNDLCCWTKRSGLLSRIHLWETN